MERLVITSTANEKFKLLKKLKDKKGRREHGLCIIEGEKVIFENLERVVDIFIVEGKEITPNIADMQPIVLSKKLFEEITDHVTPQGIFATVDFTKDLHGNASALYVNKFNAVPWLSDSPFLVLDRIQDCGNMGTLLRTARAFGFYNVFTIDCADAFSQKALRAGMANQFGLRIFSLGLETFLDLVKHKDFPEVEFYVADMNGENLLESDFVSFGLVLGNEGQGVAKELFGLRNAKVVTVPMEKGVESLNVGVAGGILMHGLRRK